MFVFLFSLFKTKRLVKCPRVLKRSGGSAFTDLSAQLHSADLSQGFLHTPTAGSKLSVNRPSASWELSKQLWSWMYFYPLSLENLCFGSGSSSTRKTLSTYFYYKPATSRIRLALLCSIYHMLSVLESQSVPHHAPHWFVYYCVLKLFFCSPGSNEFKLNYKFSTPFFHAGWLYLTARSTHLLINTFFLCKPECFSAQTFHFHIMF